MVEESGLTEGVVERVRGVLARLAQAEAMAHRTSEHDARLHELGSLDTLVDVIGAVVGLDLLGAQRVYSSPLPSGSGVILGEHGPMPSPSPATVALLAMARGTGGASAARGPPRREKWSPPPAPPFSRPWRLLLSPP